MFLGDPAISRAGQSADSPISLRLPNVFRIKVDWASLHQTLHMKPSYSKSRYIIRSRFERLI